MRIINVVSVNVGQPRPLPLPCGCQVNSSMPRLPIDPEQQDIEVTTLGLEEDQSADKRFHGGPTKALYAYPLEHLQQWEEEFGKAFPPGSMGENLTIQGMTEKEIRIGDQWLWGDVRLRVRGQRTPCFKLNAVHGDGTAEAMMANGRSGCYLEVTRPNGTVARNPIIVVGGDGITIAESFSRKMLNFSIPQHTCD